MLGSEILIQRIEKAVNNVMIENGISQGISKPSIHSQPGMLVTESVAGTQTIAPGGAVHTLVKLVIQMPLHAVLFQPANRAAGLAASLPDFVTQKVRHKSIPFGKMQALYTIGSPGNDS
jgi:hypothetical protein